MTTGCSGEIPFVDDVFVGSTVDPQSNQRDYLVQDYNVKKVEELPVSKLSKFDVSGPDYSGIEEIGSHLGDVEGSELTEDDSIGVYISTYHVKKGSGKKVKIATHPSFSLDIMKCFDGTDFYKNNGYDADSDVNEFLKDAQDYIAPSSKAEQADKDKVTVALAKVLSSTRDAYAEPTFEEYHKVEHNVALALSSALSNDGIENYYVDAKSAQVLTAPEKAESAFDWGADLHVVIVDHVDVLDQWSVFYRAMNNGADQGSQAPAENIRGAMSGGYSITERSFMGIVEKPAEVSVAYSSNPDMFVCLNYAQVPTVLVAVGFQDSNSKEVSKVAELIKNGIVNWVGVSTEE